MPVVLTRRSKREPFAPIEVRGLAPGLSRGAAMRQARKVVEDLLPKLRGFDFRAFTWDAKRGRAVFV